MTSKFTIKDGRTSKMAVKRQPGGRGLTMISNMSFVVAKLIKEDRMNMRSYVAYDLTIILEIDRVDD